MCTGNTPSAPTPKKAPVMPSVVAPMEADSSAAAAGELERKRRQAASGRSDTILTGGAGDTSQAQVGNKKFLGE